MSSRSPLKRCSCLAFVALGLACSGPESAANSATASEASQHPCEQHIFDVVMRCADNPEHPDCAEADASPACTSKADLDAEQLTQWTDEKMEEMTAALITRMKQCFEAKDADCLWNKYFALAMGAKMLGHRIASDNMLNFLSCRTDRVFLRPSYLRSDEEVQRFEAYASHQLACAPSSSERTKLAPRDIGTGGGDLYYGLGAFRMSASTDSDRRQATLHMRDRYDWHGDAGVEINGQFVLDDWAHWLVKQGKACEFDIESQYTIPLAKAGCSPATADSVDRYACYDCLQYNDPSCDEVCFGNSCHDCLEGASAQSCKAACLAPVCLACLQEGDNENCSFFCTYEDACLDCVQYGGGQGCVQTCTTHTGLDSHGGESHPA